MEALTKNLQYFKFCFYGFLKNLRFFDAFFILFLVEKGMSYTQIGILYAVREITINIFEVPSGIAADTFGRKDSLVGSFIFYIISFVVFYFSGNFWFFFLAFVLYGIADAFRTGTHKGIIMDYLKMNGWENQKINYYGHTRSWSQKGSAVSALIAGVIVFYSGSYQTIFLYSVIPYLLNLMLIVSYPKELNHTFNKVKMKNKAGMRLTTKMLFKMIKEPRVLQIINTSALHTAYLSAVKDYIQPLMVSVALLIPIMLSTEPEKKNGVIIGVFYFFVYLATAYASKYSSKVAGIKKLNISHITLLLGFILGMISGVFYVFHFSVISMIAFIGIYIVENIRKPILTGYVANQVPNEILASVISVQSLLKTIITAVLAFVFGILADYFGIGKAFIYVSLSLILSSVFINFYTSKKNGYIRNSNSN